MTKDDIKRLICHRCDGPVTPYVAIARAFEYAKRVSCPAEVMADALYEVLVDDLGALDYSAGISTLEDG